MDDDTARRYSIWAEGYQATGESGGATLFGFCYGADFKDACIRYFAKEARHAQYFNPDRMTYWGCRLFDNSNDARRSYG